LSIPVSIDCTSNFRCVQVYSLVQQRKNQSCQSKNKSCLISSALDKKHSELLTYEQFVVTYITEGPGEIIITVLANIKVIQSFTVIRIDCLPFAVAKRFV
ncbi:hypothetical protein C7818_1231, partial [Leuconostoc mesenteroides]